MEDVIELSRRELLALKVIRRTGRTNDRTMALQLINDGKMIVSQDGWLQLTAKGRQILVRGSHFGTSHRECKITLRIN